MECEFCAMEGMASEATVKCLECGEWMCAEHTAHTSQGEALCPGCLENAEEPSEEDLGAGIEEFD